MYKKVIAISRIVSAIKAPVYVIDACLLTNNLKKFPVTSKKEETLRCSFIAFYSAVIQVTNYVQLVMTIVKSHWC